MLQLFTLSCSDPVCAMHQQQRQRVSLCGCSSQEQLTLSGDQEWGGGKGSSLGAGESTGLVLLHLLDQLDIGCCRYTGCTAGTGVLKDKSMPKPSGLLFVVTTSPKARQMGFEAP